MALSVNATIDANDIADFELIKDGKIIVLFGMGTDKIVLKWETVIYDPQHVKNANTAMKVVDPKAKLKLLTAVEAAIVRDFIDNEKTNGNAFNIGVKGSKVQKDQWVDTAIDGLSDLADGNQPVPTWEKMAFVDVKDLDGALKKRMDGDKSEIKLFIRTLKAGSGKPDGGLEMLGKIIAADQFTGNTDRFVPSDCTGKFVYNGKKISFQTIQNLTNVFVAATGATAAVSGIDFVDGASAFKNIDQKITDIESGGIPWPFRVIADKTQRNAFAAKIAADLELCLNPKKGSMNPFSKLGGDAAKRISKGMVMGAQLIKNKLDAKFKNPRSPGVIERYAVVKDVKD